jgi:hypothetical protein
MKKAFLAAAIVGAAAAGVIIYLTRRNRFDAALDDAQDFADDAADAVGEGADKASYMAADFARKAKRKMNHVAEDTI